MISSSVQAIHIGTLPLQPSTPATQGEFVQRDGIEYYKISNYDQLPPFFMTVVSDADHWLYVSSKGGLTAGRKNPENALFPYYTDDKIHDSGELTGSKTAMLVEKGKTTYLWEPFSERFAGVYRLSRNLYKNIAGNQLIFEEINHDLQLTFTYGWYSSDAYGVVKKSRLLAGGSEKINVRILDGLQNLLPYGVNLKMQTERSTLLDAYKKNELLEPSGLGLFLLSSIPVDKAEPSESLQATTVWSTGLSSNTHLLSVRQLDAFRRGQALQHETDVRAERGAYLVESTISLAPDDHKEWYFIAEVNQGPAEVVALADWISADNNLVKHLEEDIQQGTRNLIDIVAGVDGLQTTSDKLLTARHFGNVLFNVMRGGIFDDNYQIGKRDFVDFVTHFNKNVVTRHETFLDGLPEEIHYTQLLQSVIEQEDDQLHRLCLEYLPLTFSRRHGDPSRPWNRFSIELREENGDQKLYYEGNWRDIFQNWEALALAYPRFLEGMISKFVNASTPDGYNPYRVTRNGIDWEVIEEDDPWSYIGYWGDHQIIYLLKLLELSRDHHPQALGRMLTQPLFAYANVPYRIRGYAAILNDPQDTVDFDHPLEETIGERVAERGADGKLVWNQKGDVLLTNLTEKILVTLLAKLSNFIPEGGIWLNTQRPEWNDANNALVGNGVSMVTLFYIRRFVTFCQSLFAGADAQEFTIAAEVNDLLTAIAATFENHKLSLNGKIDDQLRRRIVDELGQAGEAYRNRVYAGFSEQTSTVGKDHLADFFTNVLTFTDHTIQANQRTDQLYHSYNLMYLQADGGIGIRYLYEMLEGQVAVLSAGVLTVEEVLDMLQALRSSALYRADQHSYVLYPDRQLPRFENKNTLPAEAVQQSELLTKMVANNDQRLIVQDVRGAYHFNGNFNNDKDIITALDALVDEYGDLPAKEAKHILATFEAVFDHQSFTGRSGTFFGYEGLGSIYWHMVSKLILAVAENYWQAVADGAPAEQIAALKDHYYDLRAGLGTHKSPENYGAFPMDPYSHTPGNAGAQQPGMTGQVKEDILSRFAELGVFVNDGRIECRPGLLQHAEFLAKATTFEYLGIDGQRQTLELPVGALAFTYCQVPFVYHRAETPYCKIHAQDGSVHQAESTRLSAEISSQIMERTGEVQRVEIGFVE